MAPRSQGGVSGRRSTWPVRSGLLVVVVIGGGEVGGIRCLFSSSMVGVALLPAVVDSDDDLSPRLRSGGLDFGQGPGEILVRLGETTPTGVVSSLGAMSWPWPCLSLSAGGGKQAAAGSRRHALHEGDALAIYGVLGVGAWGISVFGLGCLSGHGPPGLHCTIANAFGASSSSGSARSCHPLADFSRRYGWGVC